MNSIKYILSRLTEQKMEITLSQGVLPLKDILTMIIGYNQEARYIIRERVSTANMYNTDPYWGVQVHNSELYSIINSNNATMDNGESRLNPATFLDDFIAKLEHTGVGTVTVYSMHGLVLLTVSKQIIA